MYLELTNNQKVKLDTKLRLKTLEIAEDLGIISKGFISRLLSMATTDEKDSFNASKNIDDKDLTSSPYLAYLNANYDDAMSYEEFSELLPFNFMLFTEVYSEIINNSIDENNYKLSKNFQNATPHHKSKTKKKYPR